MDETRNISEASRCALTQEIRGKSPQGLQLRVPKRVLFLSSIQRGLSATYPVPILTAFKTKDVNRCAHEYTGKKFRISAQGILQVAKQLKIGTFDGCLFLRLELTRYNFGQ